MKNFFYLFRNFSQCFVTTYQQDLLEKKYIKTKNNLLYFFSIYFTDFSQ